MSLFRWLRRGSVFPPAPTQREVVEARAVRERRQASYEALRSRAAWTGADGMRWAPEDDRLHLEACWRCEGQRHAWHHTPEGDKPTIRAAVNDLGTCDQCLQDLRAGATV